MFTDLFHHKLVSLPNPCIRYQPFHSASMNNGISVDGVHLEDSSCCYVGQACDKLKKKLSLGDC